jgi:hypothetical protein
MNDIAANYFFAHALEFRLLLALLIVPVTYATIQTIELAARAAQSILAKVNSVGANHASTAAYSAAGGR